jgi:hypothetical protein
MLKHLSLGTNLCAQLRADLFGQAEESVAPDFDGQLGRVLLCAGLGDWFVARNEPARHAHGGAGAAAGK